MPISSVAFRPDGLALASSDAKGGVRVWDGRSWEQVAQFAIQSRSGSRSVVAFSPDGGRLAVMYCNMLGLSTADLKAIETSVRYTDSEYNCDSPESLQWSPDGRLLLGLTGEGRVLIWDPWAKRLAQPRMDRAGSYSSRTVGVGVLRSGALITHHRDGSIRSWALAPGGEGVPLDSGGVVLRSAMANYVGSGLAVSPQDGRSLLLSAGIADDGTVAPSYEAKTVGVWAHDVRNQFKGIWTQAQGLRRLSFSPDERWVLGIRNSSLVFLSAADGKELTSLTWKEGTPRAYALAPGRPFLAVVEPQGSALEIKFTTIDAAILASRPDLRKAMASKDEFEKQDDFYRRIEEARWEYMKVVLEREEQVLVERQRRVAASRKRVTLAATSVSLGRYDAEKEQFAVTVDGYATTITIPPDDAKALSQNRTQIVVEAVEQLGPDLASVQRVNLRLVHPTTLAKYPIGPQIVLTDEVVAATKPAALEIVDPKFVDEDGDNRLGAGETAVLQFTVRNAGEGPGQGLRVVGSGAPGIEGLSAAVGRIEPGESKPVTLTLVGSESLVDGTAEIRLDVSEANGFNAPPLAVKIPTYSFRPPELEVAEVGVEDMQGSSVIRNGQVVTLTIRVRNAGQGRATGVEADIVPGPGVSLAEVPDPRRTALPVGDLEAGAFRDVRVKAFANAEVQGRFPVEVALRESSHRFAVAAKDLGLSLVTPQRTVAQLEVTAREAVSSAAGSAAAPRLASDLLASIPMAKQENAEAIAVIIGNRSYQSAPGVAFATNDAAVMRQYAERALGIRPGNVIYLEDATLTNLQVVFGREGDASGRLKDLVKPGVSEVFVFYSGHGAPDASERKAYLMPVDADAARLRLSGFSIDVLYANLAALQAKHVTVVLDACFSGATGGGEMLITSASPIGIQVNDPSARFGSQGATILTAAAGQQLANWFPERRHGLFTYFFLKGLQGSADVDQDGAVTLGEMKAWLTNPTAGVPEKSRSLYGSNREQVPQVWGDTARLLRP